MLVKPRFLVLRGGAIGDFLMTLPAIQALREQWPDAHIELIGYPHVTELAHAGNAINAFKSLDESCMAQLFSQKPNFPNDQIEYLQSFDIIFSYLHDPDAVVKNNMLKLGAKRVVHGSPMVKDCHAIDHLLKPLEEVDIFKQNASPSLELQEDLQRQEGHSWLEKHKLHSPVLAIHPGSGCTSKNWPALRFVELYHRVREKGWNAFFILGEADRHAASVLAEQLPDTPVLCDCKLTKTAAVLSVCDSYVGNDSGITHLAAALEIPVVALFGPTPPEQWGPRGPHVTILHADNRQLTTLSVNKVMRALVS